MHTTPYGAWHFEEFTAQQALLDLFGVSTLDGFGCEGKPLAVRAAGALVGYLRETQMGSLPQLQPLRTYSIADYMLLDEATRRSLELTESVRGGSVKGSLLGVIDATRTPMGARLLRRRLGQPLVDADRLERRLEQVDTWFSDDSSRSELRSRLTGFGDLERWTNRAVARQAQPRELLGMCSAIARARSILDADRGAGASSGAGEDSLVLSEDVAALVAAALADEPPALLGTPGVIRPGYSAELDGVYAGSRTAREWIAGLEPAERQRTGIKSLKVGFNKVFGYYLEISNANAGAVPSDYVRKQTLVNAERYITSELKEYESLVLNAGIAYSGDRTPVVRRLCSTALPSERAPCWLLRRQSPRSTSPLPSQKLPATTGTFAPSLTASKRSCCAAAGIRSWNE